MFGIVDKTFPCKEDPTWKCEECPEAPGEECVVSVPETPYTPRKWYKQPIVYILGAGLLVVLSIVADDVASRRSKKRR